MTDGWCFWSVRTISALSTYSATDSGASRSICTGTRPCPRTSISCWANGKAVQSPRTCIVWPPCSPPTTVARRYPRGSGTYSNGVTGARPSGMNAISWRSSDTSRQTPDGHPSWSGQRIGNGAASGNGCIRADVSSRPHWSHCRQTGANSW